ncbi:Helix-turn-helix [Bartonella vinsonii]|uniref:Helix-turn-helix n=1 Tax=Bartonella vinsonii TaxID=33047 RepID=A0A448V3S3_BARVI|nr:Helix-turn-helix [Bartonella vinsonii]
MLKMSQKELEHHLGVNFQQIQKYETRLNRVNTRRLKEISERLDTPISCLGGYPHKTRTSTPS